MAPRRESRERALGLCYEREARSISADQLLDDLPAAPDAYAEELLRGVEQHEPELDGLLREYSQHWAVERMPAVDRAVLRIGLYEAIDARELDPDAARTGWQVSRRDVRGAGHGRAAPCFDAK